MRLFYLKAPLLRIFRTFLKTEHFNNKKKIANNFPTKKWKIANTYLLSETNQHLIVIPFSLRLVSHLFLCVFCVCRERGSEGEDGGSEE